MICLQSGGNSLDSKTESLALKCACAPGVYLPHEHEVVSKQYCMIGHYICYCGNCITLGLIAS